MIIVCGKDISEIEQNLEMVKTAMASGMPCGIGGTTMADVEEALRMMGHMALSNAISNPNYVSDEWDDVSECCPDCGSVEYYDPYTDTCKFCGYGIEEEEEVDPLEEQATRLRENGLYYTPAVDALLNTLSNFLNH
jgi:hypothetical protein